MQIYNEIPFSVGLLGVFSLATAFSVACASGPTLLTIFDTVIGILCLAYKYKAVSVGVKSFTWTNIFRLLFAVRVICFGVSIAICLNFLTVQDLAKSLVGSNRADVVLGCISSVILAFSVFAMPRFQGIVSRSLSTKFTAFFSHTILLGAICVLTCFASSMLTLPFHMMIAYILIKYTISRKLVVFYPAHGLWVFLYTASFLLLIMVNLFMESIIYTTPGGDQSILPIDKRLRLYMYIGIPVWKASSAEDSDNIISALRPVLVTTTVSLILIVYSLIWCRYEDDFVFFRDDFSLTILTEKAKEVRELVERLCSSIRSGRYESKSRLLSNNPGYTVTNVHGRMLLKKSTGDLSTQGTSRISEDRSNFTCGFAERMLNKRLMRGKSMGVQRSRAITTKLGSYNTFPTLQESKTFPSSTDVTTVGAMQKILSNGNDKTDGNNNGLESSTGNPLIPHTLGGGTISREFRVDFVNIDRANKEDILGIHPDQCIRSPSNNFLVPKNGLITGGIDTVTHFIPCDIHGLGFGPDAQNTLQSDLECECVECANMRLIEAESRLSELQKLITQLKVGRILRVVCTILLAPFILLWCTFRPGLIGSPLIFCFICCLKLWSFMCVHRKLMKMDKLSHRYVVVRGYLQRSGSIWFRVSTYCKIYTVLASWLVSYGSCICAYTAGCIESTLSLERKLQFIGIQGSGGIYESFLIYGGVSVLLLATAASFSIMGPTGREVLLSSVSDELGSPCSDSHRIGRCETSTKIDWSTFRRNMGTAKILMYFAIQGIPNALSSSWFMVIFTVVASALNSYLAGFWNLVDVILVTLSIFLFLSRAINSPHPDVRGALSSRGVVKTLIMRSIHFLIPRYSFVLLSIRGMCLFSAMSSPISQFWTEEEMGIYHIVLGRLSIGHCMIKISIIIWSFLPDFLNFPYSEPIKKRSIVSVDTMVSRVNNLCSDIPRVANEAGDPKIYQYHVVSIGEEISSCSSPTSIGGTTPSQKEPAGVISHFDVTQDEAPYQAPPRKSSKRLTSMSSSSFREKTQTLESSLAFILDDTSIENLSRELDIHISFLKDVKFVDVFLYQNIQSLGNVLQLIVLLVQILCVIYTDKINLAFHLLVVILVQVVIFRMAEGVPIRNLKGFYLTTTVVAAIHLFVHCSGGFLSTAIQIGDGNKAIDTKELVFVVVISIVHLLLTVFIAYASRLEVRMSTRFDLCGSSAGIRKNSVVGIFLSEKGKALPRGSRRDKHQIEEDVNYAVPNHYSLPKICSSGISVWVTIAAVLDRLCHGFVFIIAFYMVCHSLGRMRFVVIVSLCAAVNLNRNWDLAISFLATLYLCACLVQVSIGVLPETNLTLPADGQASENVDDMASIDSIRSLVIIVPCVLQAYVRNFVRNSEIGNCTGNCKKIHSFLSGVSNEENEKIEESRDILNTRTTRNVSSSNKHRSFWGSYADSRAARFLSQIFNTVTKNDTTNRCLLPHHIMYYCGTTLVTFLFLIGPVVCTNIYSPLFAILGLILCFFRYSDIWDGRVVRARGCNPSLKLSMVLWVMSIVVTGVIIFWIYSLTFSHCVILPVIEAFVGTTSTENKINLLNSDWSNYLMCPTYGAQRVSVFDDFFNDTFYAYILLVCINMCRKSISDQHYIDSFRFIEDQLSPKHQSDNIDRADIASGSIPVGRFFCHWRMENFIKSFARFIVSKTHPFCCLSLVMGSTLLNGASHLWSSISLLYFVRMSIVSVSDAKSFVRIGQMSIHNLLFVVCFAIGNCIYQMPGFDCGHWSGDCQKYATHLNNNLELPVVPKSECIAYQNRFLEIGSESHPNCEDHHLVSLPMIVVRILGVYKAESGWKSLVSVQTVMIAAAVLLYSVVRSRAYLIDWTEYCRRESNFDEPRAHRSIIEMNTRLYLNEINALNHLEAEETRFHRVRKFLAKFDRSFNRAHDSLSKYFNKSNARILSNGDTHIETWNSIPENGLHLEPQKSGEDSGTSSGINNDDTSGTSFPNSSSVNNEKQHEDLIIALQARGANQKEAFLISRLTGTNKRMAYEILMSLDNVTTCKMRDTEFITDHVCAADNKEYDGFFTESYKCLRRYLVSNINDPLFFRHWHHSLSFHRRNDGIFSLFFKCFQSNLLFVIYSIVPFSFLCCTSILDVVRIGFMLWMLHRWPFPSRTSLIILVYMTYAVIILRTIYQIPLTCPSGEDFSTEFQMIWARENHTAWNFTREGRPIDTHEDCSAPASVPYSAIFGVLKVSGSASFRGLHNKYLLWYLWPDFLGLILTLMYIRSRITLGTWKHVDIANTSEEPVSVFVSRSVGPVASSSVSSNWTFDSPLRVDRSGYLQECIRDCAPTRMHTMVTTPSVPSVITNDVMGTYTSIQISTHIPLMPYLERLHVLLLLINYRRQMRIAAQLRFHNFDAVHISPEQRLDSCHNLLEHISNGSVLSKIRNWLYPFSDVKVGIDLSTPILIVSIFMVLWLICFFSQISGGVGSFESVIFNSVISDSMAILLSAHFVLIITDRICYIKAGNIRGERAMNDQMHRKGIDLNNSESGNMTHKVSVQSNSYSRVDSAIGLDNSLAHQSPVTCSRGEHISVFWCIVRLLLIGVIFLVAHFFILQQLVHRGAWFELAIGRPFLSVYYFMIIVYLTLSVHQLKRGYPLVIKDGLRPELQDDSSGNIFSRGIFLFANFIPFLDELRVLIAWTFSNTTLDLQQFFKLEDVHNNIWWVQSEMIERREQWPAERKKKYSERGMTGGSLIIIALLIILMPIIIFAMISPTGLPTEIRDVRLSTTVKLTRIDFLDDLGKEHTSLFSSTKIYDEAPNRIERIDGQEARDFLFSARRLPNMWNSAASTAHFEPYTYSTPRPAHEYTCIALMALSGMDRKSQVRHNATLKEQNSGEDESINEHGEHDDTHKNTDLRRCPHREISEHAILRIEIDVLLDYKMTTATDSEGDLDFSREKQFSYRQCICAYVYPNTTNTDQTHLAEMCRDCQYPRSKSKTDVDRIIFRVRGNALYKLFRNYMHHNEKMRRLENPVGYRPGMFKKKPLSIIIGKLPYIQELDTDGSIVKSYIVSDLQAVNTLENVVGDNDIYLTLTLEEKERDTMFKLTACQGDRKGRYNAPECRNFRQMALNGLESINTDLDVDAIEHSEHPDHKGDEKTKEDEYHVNGIEFKFITPPVIIPKKISKWILDIGLIGFYLTVVTALGAFVRVMHDKSSFFVVYEEIPNPEILLNIVTVIKASTRFHHLKREFQLYSQLIKLLRSPQFLIAICGKDQTVFGHGRHDTPPFPE